MLPWEELRGAEIVRDAVRAFGAAIGTRVPLHGTCNFYEERLLRDAMEEESLKVFEEFAKTLENESEEQRIELIEKLGAEIDKVFSLINQTNEKNQKNAKIKLDNLVKNLVQKYKSAISSHLAQNKYLDFELLQGFHADAKLSLVNHFMRERKPGNGQFHMSYQGRIEAEIDSIYQEIEKKHMSTLEEFFNKEDKLIAEQKKKFKLELEKTYGRRVTTAAELKKECGDDLMAFMMNFNKNSNPHQQSSPERTYLAQRLKQELNKVVELVGMEIEENRVKKLKGWEAPREAINLCIAYYNSIMDKQRDRATKRFMDESDLQLLHENTLNDAIRKYVSLERARNKEQERSIWNEKQLELENLLKKKFSQRIQENQKRHENAKRRADATVKNCFEAFEARMQVNVERELVQENFFEGHYHDAKEVALRTFAERTKNKDSTFYRSYLDNLQEKIEESKINFKLFFDMNVLNERSTIQGVLKAYLHFYHDEMKKRFEGKIFMKSSQLKIAHEKARAFLLSKCEQRIHGRASRFQRNELERGIDALYDFYEAKNDLKLNSNCPAPVIGIDVGTTYSCVGVYYNDKLHICSYFQSEDERTIPSYVAFSEEDGEVKETVGPQAKKDAYTNELNTIFDAKRLIGRKWDDPSVQRNIKHWPFKVEQVDGVPKIGVFGGRRYFAPEEVSAKLLYELIGMAEAFIGLPRGSVKKAVITVPANFNDGQRQATKDAGIMAGLEEVTLMHEPTAAAVAYTLEKIRSDAEKVLVFDFGGGTFDVCMMKVRKRDIEVLASAGDTDLGGQKLDTSLMTFCAERFRLQFPQYDIIAGMEQTENPDLQEECRKSWGRLQGYCEEAKKKLSSGTRATITIPYFFRDQALVTDVTRQQFEEMNKEYFQKTIDLLKEVMNEAGIKKQEIEEIVLVGGSTRIPKVQELLEEYFEGKSLTKSIQPDHAVAHGAAVMAALKYAENAKQKINFDGIEDVISMSLGIAVIIDRVPNCFSKIIKKFTKIPTSRTERGYSTTYDNQTVVSIKIYQGDSSMVNDNELLGSFDLTGIRPAPAKEEKIDVCMTIDEAGILHVTATSQSGGQQNSLEVTEFKSRMTKEAIRAVLAEETTRRKLRQLRTEIDELAEEVSKFSGPHFTREYKQHKELHDHLIAALNDLELDVMHLNELQVQWRNSKSAVSACLQALRSKTHDDLRSCANCEILVDSQ